MVPSLARGWVNARTHPDGKIGARKLHVKYLDAEINQLTMGGMERDLIDEMNRQWSAALPGLDPAPLEVVGRVIVIAQYLEKSVNAALAAHGLSLGQFDILATLRRQGPNGRLTPTQLMRSVMLSSGGMTNRLDRLEETGLVQRRADPDDRRGVVVGLTRRGRAVIDAATADRFAEAAASLPPLSAAELKALAGLLRKWLVQLAGPRGEAKARAC
jgi:DNA-binding MarR family transcriptional regulator